MNSQNWKPAAIIRRTGVVFAAVVLALALIVVAIATVIKVSSQWKPSETSRLLDEAFAVYRNGELERALRLIDKAREESPNQPLAHVWSVSVRMELGRWHEALSQADTALRLFPDHCSILDMKGDILMHLAQTNEAVDCYRAYIAKCPVGYWAPWLKLGAAYEQMDELENARDVYLRALDLNPRLEEAQQRLAHLK